ncbi:MAG: protoporphyrinogen/coproporphyrinogen oxidase, partial [Microbacterium sp.]|uniref:protoporphyrinogen/coproporphyrinogen oxidase n=1 Tax=Microbacterium sp. TaxID=51671 RepID=UPI003A88F5C3
GDDVVASSSAHAGVAGLPGGVAAPLPEGTVLGIPASPFAPEVQQILGTRGAWRAYADRVKPVLTVGTERSLGVLVRSRLGARVLDRIVAPVTLGVYGVHPDDIDVGIAAPGLNGALTTTGSLLAAVAAQGAAAGAGPASIRGGMLRLVEALCSRLELLGATLRTGTRVEAVVRDEDGWRVDTDEELDADPGALRADAVIVATPEGEARRLLDAAGPLPVEPAAEFPVETVTLVIDAPTLDESPRGPTVYTVPGTSAATTLAHKSVTWEWLAGAAGGRHVLRVSFGTQAEPPATAGLSDEEAVALAVREASTLLGAPLAVDVVAFGRRERFTQTLPGAAIGRRDAARTVRESLAAVPALGVVGAWLAGSGLAQVVPDAVHEADRVRDAVLWD